MISYLRRLGTIARALMIRYIFQSLDSSHVNQDPNISSVDALSMMVENMHKMS